MPRFNVPNMTYQHTTTIGQPTQTRQSGVVPRSAAKGVLHVSASQGSWHDTDPGLGALVVPDSAGVLSFRGKRGATDAMLATMVRLGMLSSCTAVDLGYCDKITDQGLKHLDALQNLRRLVLEGCISLSPAGLKVVAALKHLRQLDMSWCPAVNDDSIATLFRLPRLQRLRLCGTRITRTGLTRCPSAPWLLQLDLRECPAIVAYDKPMIGRTLGLSDGAILV